MNWMLIVAVIIGAAVLVWKRLDSDERDTAKKNLKRVRNRSIPKAPLADLSAPAKWTPLEKLAVAEEPSPRKAAGPCWTADNRIVVGLTPDGRKVIAPKDLPCGVVGGTGSGKTSGLIGPGIIGWNGPVINATIGTDLLEETLVARRRLGPVMVYDPSGSLPFEYSDLARPWTPLVGCDTFRDAYKQAVALMAGGSESRGGDGAFWDDQGVMLLAPLLYVESLLGGSMRGVNRWLANLLAKKEAQGMNIDEFADEEDEKEIAATFDALVELLNQFAESHAKGKSGARFAGAASARDMVKPFMTMDERTSGSVIASVNRALRAYKIGGTDADLRVGDPRAINVEEVLRSNGTIYIVGGLLDQQTYKPLFTAFTSHVYEVAFKIAAREPHPRRLPNDLLVALDELASIARIPNLGPIVSNARKFGITTLWALQSLAQLREVYGENTANAIVSNTETVLILPNTKDPVTSEWASTQAGDQRVKTTTKSKNASESKNRGELSASGTSTSKSWNETWETRPLATKGNIGQIPKGQMLAFMGPHRAVLHQRTWFADPELVAIRQEAAAHREQLLAAGDTRGGLAAREPRPTSPTPDEDVVDLHTFTVDDEDDGLVDLFPDE